MPVFCWLYKQHLFLQFIAKDDSIHHSELYEGHRHLFLQASRLDSFVENSSQDLQTKFENQSLCFNIVTSEPRLFQWIVTCMCGRTQSELYSQHRHVIHKEASGRHLLYPAPILLVLFSTFLDQRQKQERPSFSCFIFVCNLQMLFLPFQTTDKKINKIKKKKKKKKKPILILAGFGSCLSLTGVVFIK